MRNTQANIYKKKKKHSKQRRTSERGVALLGASRSRDLCIDTFDARPHIERTRNRKQRKEWFLPNYVKAMTCV